MDTAGDYRELSSFGNGEGESSSVGDSEEEETAQVGEIVKAFSTLAFCNVS